MKGVNLKFILFPVCYNLFDDTEKYGGVPTTMISEA